MRPFVEDYGREQLARWLTDQKNPYFSRAIVNRLWRAMMGRGLVEPVDDLRASNPATHPALLVELADDFAAGGFSLRHTLRQIAISDTYQMGSDASDRSSQSHESYFVRSLRRPLEPQVLADAISSVLGKPEKYGSLPLGTRAINLVGPTIESTSLDILGRCSREDSCESSGLASGGLSQKLHLFNGRLLNARIASPDALHAQWLQQGKSAVSIIDRLYRLALTRPPSEDELKYWHRQIPDRQQELRAFLDDFLWSLLSCREFTTNH